MSQLSSILRDQIDGNGHKHLAFLCPGCGMPHSIIITGDKAWGWNGDVEKPTFTPSILVQHEEWTPPVTSENLAQWKASPWVQHKVEKVCHSFVTSGRIEFLTDCTHELAGKTVDLPPWKECHE